MVPRWQCITKNSIIERDGTLAEQETNDMGMKIESAFMSFVALSLLYIDFQI